MKFVAVALCLLAVLAVVNADGDSKVATLEEGTFDTYIKEHDLTLVEFYAPWCGHCKQLAPQYEKAAKELEGKNAGYLAKVDCTVHRELCNRFEVRGFPTLKLFRSDGDPVDYDSGRTADAIVKYMIKQNSPAVSTLDSIDAVENFAKSDPVKIVAFVNAGDSLDKYTKVANSMRNEFSFGAVVGKDDVNAQFKVTAPAVVVFRDFDEGPVTFTGTFNSDSFSDDLSDFITAQSFPVVGEIGPENYGKYVDRGYNFVWIFIDKSNTEHADLITNAVTPVAKDHRDKLSFVKIDGVRWGEHAKSFGLSGNTPGIVIENRETRKNYIFPESDKVTPDAFKTFISSYFDGSLAPNVKSEPIPESNDGPVKVIVGKTFDEIVLDDTKDVFVEFYAPWCGHCKSLAPKYEELGTLFKDEPNVVIAKIDATANDSPADVQGFPTLILYPAGAKKNPVDYQGERTVKAMAAFIRKNGQVVKKDGAVPEEEEEEEHDHEHHGGEHDDL